MKTIRSIGVYSNGCVYHNVAVRVLEDWYTEDQVSVLLRGEEVETEDGEYEFIEDEEE